MISDLPRGTDSSCFPTRAESAIAQVVNQRRFYREPFLFNPIQRDGNKALMGK